MLGRLPDPEALLLLTRRDRNFAAFADLRGATIGIGPEQSGTAYFVPQLFADQDLHSFEVRLVISPWSSRRNWLREANSTSRLS